MTENSFRSKIASKDHLTTTPHRLIVHSTDRCRIVIPAFLSLFVLGSLFSCGIGVRTRAVLGKKIHVKVDISENANNNSPIALDVLLVYDEALLAELIKMPSKEWFEKREQIKRDYPEGTGLDYWGWEWVPGQKVPVQSLPLKPKAKGGIIFANYFCPGEHRFSIDPFKDFIIRLQEESFTVEVSE